MSDKEATIKQMIAEKLGVREDQVTPQASFMEDLGADSLDLLEMIVAFKCTFDIEIPMNVVAETHTIGDLVKVVEARIRKA